LSWQLGDLLERTGIKKNRWRAQTGVSAFDPPSRTREISEPVLDTLPAL